MKKGLLFLFIGLILYVGKSEGQVKTPTDDEKINGLFAGIPFKRFAQLIESSTNFRFYFSEEETQDLSVNISAIDNSLNQVLSGIFENTDFLFTIDEKKRVFITKGKKLDLSLPDDFFTRKTTGAEQDSLARLSDIERTFSRNKLYVIGANASGQEAVLMGRVTGIETGNPVFGAIVCEKINFTRAIANEMENSRSNSFGKTYPFHSWPG